MSPTTPLSRIERRTKMEKIITALIYYGLPVIVATTLILSINSAQNLGIRTQERRGENGANLLIIVLFIKPIVLLGKKYAYAQIITAKQAINELRAVINYSKHSQRKASLSTIATVAIDTIFSLSTYLMRFRRQIGVACFWFILAHAGLLQIFRHRAELPLFFNIGESKVFTGILGIIGLLVAAITSNNLSMQKLKLTWKPVQMIAVYVAFFFAVLHTGNILALILLIVLKYFEAKETKAGLFIEIQKGVKKLIQVIQKKLHK
ncbi:MAG: hypothetical protein WCO66_03480 [Candidatus Absconditabacteria bacterium]